MKLSRTKLIETILEHIPEDAEIDAEAVLEMLEYCSRPLREISRDYFKAEMESPMMEEKFGSVKEAFEKFCAKTPETPKKGVNINL
jgi:hypothetical protein